jgi:hypothetical protein
MSMGGGRGPKLNPSTDVARLSGLVIVIVNFGVKKEGDLLQFPHDFTVGFD